MPLRQISARAARAARAALQLTQAEMARFLGVSFASVNRWEQDRGTGPRGLAAQVYRAISRARHRTTLMRLREIPHEANRGVALMRLFTAAWTPVGPPRR
jgi:transcriptional regulator with XRE-family HTH domain